MKVIRKTVYLALLLLGVVLAWLGSHHFDFSEVAQTSLLRSPAGAAQASFYPVSLPDASPSYLPSDVGFVNVKEFGATGDGVTDDTAALQQVLGRNKDEPGGAIRNIYFPNGTYLISGPLIWGDKRKEVWGESRDGVVIKLKDNAPGFQNPEQPQKVLQVEYGHGGQNFDQRLHNLTVDIGQGNSGAIGIGFHTNNSGGMSDIVIRSSDREKRGFIGLALDKEWPGPGLIENVAIDGFDTGIYITQDQYSMTFEHITLTNQRQVGFVNSWNSVAIRDLKSVNRVTAIENRGEMALMALVEADLRGGDAFGCCGANRTVPAIVNHAEGVLFARDIQTEGYGWAIDNQSGHLQKLDADNVDEFVSHNTSSLFASPPHSLSLPIEDPPGIPIGNPSTWVSVMQFGATPHDDQDDGAAIQAAIDSGAKTVYLPAGSYQSQQTIRVRNQVQRLIGFGASVRFNVPGQPAFVIEEGTGEAIALNVETTYGNQCSYWVEHASTRTLVLKQGSYINTVPGGKVFIADSSSVPLVFDHQQVWMRQINTESYDHNPHIVNRGGDLWILGLKTEKDRTIIGTYEGGRTEVLGGLLYKNRERVGPAPAFIAEDSSISLVYRNKGIPYQTQVQESRNGVTQEFSVRQMPARHWRMPLYVGYED